ncbi:MAG: aminodeoxychorismate/anthranilate synthase component II [Pseudomonadota bacterium]
MILLIDNYDSFTFNLVHYLGHLGAEVRVERNDALSVQEALALKPRAIVLSPGPGTPDTAGICLNLVAQAPADMPIMGVCLGHQAIGQVYGGTVERCHEVLHGKLSTIGHSGSGIFEGVPQGFLATRYHSLTVAPESMPDGLEVTARSQSGVVMGISHRDRPVHGVQFHPESIASEHGHAMLANFLRIAGLTPAEAGS